MQNTREFFPRFPEASWTTLIPMGGQTPPLPPLPKTNCHLPLPKAKSKHLRHTKYIVLP